MTKRNIVHVEIPVTDASKSQTFYSDLCGWEFTTSPDFNYTNSLGGNVAIGFVDIDNENVLANKVVCYIGSDDIEADLKRVEELGGKVIQPVMNVGDYGSFAVFEDPAGNHLAFWKEGSATS